MKLVLLGSSGFLGKRIKDFIKDYDVRLTCPTREDFNFKNNNLKFSSKLSEELNNADTCINCIAETNFNICESDSKSKIANELIPLELSKLLDKSQYMIHLSSDIFYEQDDNFSSEKSSLKINNEYAAQKSNGERVLNKINPLILRTSFVGMNHRGAGLLNHIQKTLANEISIDGWNNVYSSSVSIEKLIDVIFLASQKQIRGIYNFGTSAPYSKFDLIKAILDNFGKKNLVKKMDLSNLAYQRNKNCGMDSTKIKKTLKIQLPNFEDIVLDCVKALKIREI